MSGSLVIKVRLGNDFRRLAIVNEEPTLDDFVLMMQRVFGAALSTSAPLVIKYQDNGVLSGASWATRNSFRVCRRRLDHNRQYG
jgi:hypothetical protein